MPIEFARVGDKSELATVLCLGAPDSSVRWAWLDTDDVKAARRLLRQREEIDEDRVDGIGTVMMGWAPATLPGAAEIERWAAARGDIDAVLWTALPPRFAGREGRVPSPSEAAGYLRDLTGRERRHAEDYVCRTPEEVRTPNREALERQIAS